LVLHKDVLVLHTDGLVGGRCCRHTMQAYTYLLLYPSTDRRNNPCTHQIRHLFLVDISRSMNRQDMQVCKDGLVVGKDGLVVGKDGLVVGKDGLVLHKDVLGLHTDGLVGGILEELESCRCSCCNCCKSCECCNCWWWLHCHQDPSVLPIVACIHNHRVVVVMVMELVVHICCLRLDLCIQQQSSFRTDLPFAKERSKMCGD